jgi:hypothetical protein
MLLGHNHADLQKDPAIFFIAPGRQVEGPNGRHHKGRRGDRTTHIVRILDLCPRIRKELPEAGDLKGHDPACYSPFEPKGHNVCPQDFSNYVFLDIGECRFSA